MIYFIKAENGLISIGYTKNIDKRYKYLKKTNPIDIELVKVIEGTKLQEIEWKKRHKEFNHHGDWFSITEDMMYCKENTKESAEILEENKKYKEKYPVISQWQEQIILGSILGCGSINKSQSSKNYFFSMSHQNKKWLMYKAEEMKEYARTTPFYKNNNKYYWSTISSPIFNKYHEMCYENGKKTVKMEWLDTLRDIGFAIWFCDKGNWFPNGNLYLKLNNIEKTETIKQFFEEVGIPCFVKKNDLIFKEEGKITFLKLIAHRLPKYMHEKLNF